MGKREEGKEGQMRREREREENRGGGEVYQLQCKKEKNKDKNIISPVIMNLPSQSTPCEFILFLQTLQNTLFLKLMGFVQWWVMGSCVDACHVFGVCRFKNSFQNKQICVCTHVCVACVAIKKFSK